MRMVLQRVKEARLTVQGEERAAIGRGLVVLVGFGHKDAPDLPGTTVWSKLLDKIVSLRIFPDHRGRSEVSINEVHGSILAVSQFTLYANWRKGRRPSFTPAAPPDLAEMLFTAFVRDLTARTSGLVVSGLFGEEMDISLRNWGPFTLSLDSQTVSKG